MKAYALHGINDIRLEERERPFPEAGEVLVKVKAIGICGSDIPRIYQTGAYRYPLIPGHEFAGQIVELGEKVDENWMGKRVGVFPLIPCQSCSACSRDKYELCRHYNYLGSRTDGGFSEYVRVPVWNLLELPDKVTFEQAAMLEPMSVAVHAIRRSQVKRGDVVLVCGLGTIGLLIVMFLQEMGNYNVYVAGNKNLQFGKAEQLGIPKKNICDIRTSVLESWIADKTREEGADVFFDCVGKNEVLEQGLNCLAAEGRMMLVGNPASDVKISRNVYWKILRQQLVLQGTWNSAFTHEEADDWHYVVKRVEAGRVKPEILITHQLDFAELTQGLEMMRDKKADYVKVMVKLCEKYKNSIL